jgi:hypothetical protein
MPPDPFEQNHSIHDRVIRLESDIQFVKENEHACKSAINQTFKDCHDSCIKTHENIYARLNALELTNARLLGIMTGVSILAAILATILGLCVQILTKML